LPDPRPRLLIGALVQSHPLCGSRLLLHALFRDCSVAGGRASTAKLTPAEAQNLLACPATGSSDGFMRFSGRSDGLVRRRIAAAFRSFRAGEASAATPGPSSVWPSGRTKGLHAAEGRTIGRP
jgi:hypothetical protein